MAAQQRRRPTAKTVSPDRSYLYYVAGAVLAIILGLQFSQTGENKLEHVPQPSNHIDHETVRTDPNSNLHLKAEAKHSSSSASTLNHNCPAVALATAAVALKFDKPAEYLAQTEAAMQQVGDMKECQSDDVMQLHDLLADAYGHMKDFKQAVTHRKASLGYLRRQRQGSASDMISQMAVLATDLYLNFEHALALTSLQKIREVVPTKALPPTFQRLLLLLEATIYECSGDDVTALQRFEAGLKSTPNAPPLSDVQRHVDLLKRVVLTQGQHMPASVVAAMQKRIQSATAILMAHGPWQREDQLPKHYQPGLLAQPWHNPSDYPHVLAAVDILRSHSDQLRREYRVLAGDGQLQRERECIHDPSGGRWMRYESTAYWRPLNPGTGCSRDTPVACEVSQLLRNTGLSVFRAGYSAIEARAWLKPHFGMTNGQLKLHLGLIVPRNDDGTACAMFRVSNTTNAWQQDQVLFFDDSFEHEVHNRCDKTRVVFQVVFAHPDLPAQTTVSDLFPKSQAAVNH